MILNTNLPSTKIVMHTDYNSPKGIYLPAGLMLTIRGIELTLHKKHIRLLAIRNKKVIENLYLDIPRDSYTDKWGSGVFYTFYNPIDHSYFVYTEGTSTEF